MSLSWMAWTWPTAAFFATIGLILVGMTVWQFASPTRERVGILRFPTTRGDRLFVSLLTAAYIHLAWLGLVSAPLWGALLVSFIVAIAIFRWV